MIKSTARNQKLGWILFIVCPITLTHLMFFAEPLGRSGRGQSTYAYNLRLFKEIKRFYIRREQLDMEAVLLSLGGNVIGFVPSGFILPIISRHGRRWYSTFMLAFGLSLGIETTQFIFEVGSFNMDDLLSSTIGGILGYIAYRLVQRFRIRGKRRARENRMDKM